MLEAILNRFLDRILLVEWDLLEKLDTYTFLNFLDAVPFAIPVECERIYLSWGIMSAESHNGSVFIEPL